MNSPATHFPGFEALDAGARFHRADLHIHSFGGSADVADATMTPQAIVAKAKERNIAMVALADHNSVANVEDLLAAADETGGAVTAIPGVEITTSDGHVLVFSAEDRLDALDVLLGKLDYLEDEQGEKYTRVPIDKIAALVEAFDGITIPAHLGREGTGFLTKAPHRECQAIFESRAIRAVELDGNAYVSWFTTADRTSGYQDRARYVQMRKDALEGTPAATRLGRLIFSDAHSLDAIGRAPDGGEKLTRIKMDRPSFEGLVAALHDPDARVVLEHPLPEIYPRIVGVRYVGGFLDTEEIAFAPNLTALIGGRGAGKSTATEALRCTCSGEGSSIEGSDAWPQTVQIEHIDSFGGRHLVQRDAGSDQTIEVLEDGTAVPVSIPLEGYEQDHIAEIIRSSDKDASLLLAFLDRFVASSAHEQIANLRLELEENAKQLLPVASAPTKLKKAMDELSAAQGRIRLAEKTNAKEALTYRRLLQGERRLRDAVRAAITQIDTAADAVPAGIDLGTLAQQAGVTDLATLPAKAILVASGGRDTVSGVLRELTVAVTAWKAAGSTERATYKKRLDLLLAEWEEQDRKLEARIQEVDETLRVQGIALDLSEINQLASAEASAQKQVVRFNAEVAERKRLVEARVKLLNRYRVTQDRLAVERNQFGKRVAEQFRDAGVEFAVGIKFREGQLVRAFEEWLREGIGNRFFRGERVTQFCQSIHPIDLAQQITTGRTRLLTSLSDSKEAPFLSEPEAREFIALLASKPERVFELEAIVRDDRPEISLTQTQDGKTSTYPFQHLSFGQRASILLGVLLFSDDPRPLVIDQPEDHLDSAFIYEAVVQTLRRVKERRQVIVATHNANIAVLGDAELIVPLRSWAGKGHVRDRGSVDTVATR